MLLPSPRHRPDDLALWAELEEADALNGERLLKSSKVDRSRDAIRDFAANGPCYAGCSFGKDSTVLFELIASTAPSIPLIWLTYGRATNPECGAVRDAMLARWPDADYREIDVGESEQMRDDFGPAVASAKTERYLSGIRAEESGIRKMSIRHLGIDTGRACRPLAWWTAAEVFGFLAARSLPVHANYGMLGGGRWNRHYLRTASIGGERGVENGRREWEREYYGDVLRRLESGR